MTTEALVEAKLNKGRIAVSSKLGKTYSAYRPAIADNPFTALFAYVTLYLKPFNKQIYETVQIFEIYGNTTVLQKGDYLVLGNETYFVGSLRNLKKPIAFRCSKSIAYSCGSGIVGNVTKWPCAVFYNSVISGRSWLFPFSVLNVFASWSDNFSAGTIYDPGANTILGGTILEDCYRVQTA
jgi:hypothetical protein